MILGVTCLRNEGPYVVDWIAHHLAAGFDHMLVLTHDCDDGSAELLNALSADDRITHLPFEFNADKTVQWQALNIAKKHPLVKDAEWVMFFDCDEYMNLPEGNVKTLVASMPEAEAIAFPWRLFGAAGQEVYDTAPVTERFRMCAPHGMNYPLSCLFKTLFKPSAFRQMGVHRPRNKKDQVAVWYASNGQKLPDQIVQQDKAISLMNAVRFDEDMAYMNHYSVRSAQEFMLKSVRGLPNHMDRRIDLSYWAERNFNVVEDTAIDRMADATVVVRGELLALPDVDILHTGSCEEHKRRIAVMLDDLENVRLIWRLGLLASSTPPPMDRAMRYIKTQIRMKKYNG
ncbi:glycosyltransferase family 2 protein [Amylibacter sp. IMCC11727]|uniref:glycosyltransferase family 2 protein n=1 Tax=Amylibacter sp. IMCC11727 TaxID=3039851 RepID=UPI00244E21EA|nr:glycosyltransferase family 2 protein [Amylibacter sp. IMCC11727]WGI22371.1 glycosyltransferase family 2 protein [Amylibacter sp. IMCC11727]